MALAFLLQFEQSSFRVGSGPCNTEFAVTINGATSDDGSAEGAIVTIEDAGNVAVQSFFQVAQAPCIYTVVEEETQAMVDLEGENTLLVVNNPMPEDGEIPGPVDPGDDDADDDTPGEQDDVVVTKLPSTGQGTAANGGMLMLASAFAAIVAGAGRWWCGPRGSSRTASVAADMENGLSPSGGGPFFVVYVIDERGERGNHMGRDVVHVLTWDHTRGLRTEAARSE